MGEYAEMMLDGTCCSRCGEWLGGDGGYPTMCAACEDEDRVAAKLSRAERGKPPYIAPDPNSKRSQKKRARRQQSPAPYPARGDDGGDATQAQGDIDGK